MICERNMIRTSCTRHATHRSRAPLLISSISRRRSATAAHLVGLPSRPRRVPWSSHDGGRGDAAAPPRQAQGPRKHGMRGNLWWRCCSASLPCTPNRLHACTPAPRHCPRFAKTQHTSALLHSHVKCMYVCMYVYMYVYMYVCMYIVMYVCMYVCMHACMHVHTYVCMHACMDVCMYGWILTDV